MKQTGWYSQEDLGEQLELLKEALIKDRELI